MGHNNDIYDMKKIDANSLFTKKHSFRSIGVYFLRIMSRRPPQIVFSYRSSDDSMSLLDERLIEESWKLREKRLETGDGSDCKIIVGDKEILTHKHVLTEFPYFKRRFDNQSNFLGDERDQIKISGYEHAIVHDMLKYMYSFKVKVSTKNVENLLRISDEYQVVGLFEKAQRFIVKRIGTENVIDCLTLTENITNATLLKSASIDYILDHYFELRQTESWKTLSWDLLNEIFHHKMLNERITDINAENADRLLYIAEGHHVKKLMEAVKRFKNQV